MNATKKIIIVSLFVSSFLFFILYGYKIVIPSNIGWLMSGDPGTHFLGWHFFRTESWSFPLGVIKNYYYPAGTSLIFTDSIALIAIPLKILEDFFPQPFQYVGLWLWFSYILQGVFASLLLKKVTDNNLLILIGMTFFLLSPTMFWRAGGHMSLAAHWLILAALYLYTTSSLNNLKSKWFILIIISSMIHFYLLVMVLAIWAGYILKELVSELTQKNIMTYIVYILTTFLTLLLTMYILGYFILPVSDAQEGGFGIYSMNILALFNPMTYSFFLPDIKVATDGQYEGFNYLGFGLIILLIISLFKLFSRINEYKVKPFLPLLGILILLFLFSLSNKISFADYILLEIPLPPILQKLGNLLRASGRMFWPVYYAIIFVILAITIKSFTTKQATFILSILLIVQIVDFYPWYSSRDLNVKKWDNPIKSKEWKSIALTVDSIVVIPPSLAQKKMYPLAFYAANNNLSINIGYVARKNNTSRKKYYNDVMKKYSSSIIEDRTLYVINKNNKFIDLDILKKYSYGKLDGYYIIAPKNNNIKITNRGELK